METYWCPPASELELSARKLADLQYNIDIFGPLYNPDSHSEGVLVQWRFSIPSGVDKPKLLVKFDEPLRTAIRTGRSNNHLSRTVEGTSCPSDAVISTAHIEGSGPC